jgi:hypothetical protein
MNGDYVWTLGVKYDPNQPRVPAGDPRGGQWTSGEGASYREFPIYESREEYEFIKQTTGGTTLPVFGEKADSIRLYTAGGYKQLNEALREGRALTPEEKKHIANLDEYTHDGALADNVILYRGLKRNTELARRFGELDGAVIIDDGFMSTTFDKLTAEEFAGMGYRTPKEYHGVLLRIRAPKGHPCGVNSTLEREITFPRGTKLRVLDQRTEEKLGSLRGDVPYTQRILEVEVVP